MVETWRAVPSNPKYEVSDMGRVRAAGSGKIKAVSLVGPRRNYAGVQLSNPDYVPAAEYRLELARSGKSNAEIAQVMADRRRDRLTSARVHRLVLEAFVGPCPEGMVGCHNDGDPLNNRLDNLRWDTPSNNERDKWVHGTHHQRRKTHCPRGHEYTPENTYEARGGRARRCKQCARDRARSQPAPKHPRSHCRQGHAMTGDNVVMEGQRRKCRECKNARQRAAYRGGK
jgi:hypothetical protein